MSEQLKPADIPEDLSALPASEFGPRGARPDPFLFSAPIMTLEKAKDHIRAAVLALEALKIDDSETPALQRAIESSRAAYAYASAHPSPKIADQQEYRR